MRRTNPSGTSPVLHPKSPPLVPNLAAASTVKPGTSPVHAAVPISVGQFRPPAPLSLGESALASVPVTSDKTGRRVDPVKFKTDLCRNWEQTGTCNFKGCTFAHGHEELRPVLRPHGGAPQPISAQAYVEHLSRMLIAEVSREVQIQMDHQEANRKLEQDLREEQTARQFLLQRLSIVEKEYEAVRNAGLEKDKTLMTLRRQVKDMGLGSPNPAPMPYPAGSGSGSGSGGAQFPNTSSRSLNQAEADGVTALRTMMSLGSPVKGRAADS
jgi:hypothetical protein